MANSKPKKGFSMSLSKTKLPSSSTAVVRTDRERPRAKPSSIGQRDGEEAEAAPKRDYVTGIGGGKVVTKEVVVERGPRVIALAPNPWAATTTNSEQANSAQSPADGAAAAASTASADGAPPRQPSAAAPPPRADKDKSLDELAAEALARESRDIGRGRNGGGGDREGLGLDSDRVITMAAQPSNVATNSSSNGSSGVAGAANTSGKRNGLLELNMIPGLADVEGEDAKFKHDLGYRAEDVSARSMAYVDVPVHEFGAALLRGMGWAGPGGNDEGAGGRGTVEDLVKDVEPRHHRLGLGAQPKPPEEMKRPRKRKPGEKARASDVERRKIWEDKAREEQARASRPSASQLSVMDVVEISGGSASEGGGRRPRAMVMKTQGVPGLNKISVRMEDSGEKTIVDKASLSRVSEDDLARRPFSDKQRARSKPDAEETPVRRRDDGASGDRERGDASRNDSAKRSRNRSRSRSVERDGDRGGGDRRDGKKQEHSQERSKKEKKKHKKSKSDNNNSNGSSSSSKRERNDRASPSPRRSEDDDQRASRRRPAPSDRDDNDGRKPDRRRDDASPNRKRPRDSSGRNGVGGEPVNIDRGGGGGGGGGGGASERSWLRASIRVRVVHKSYAGGRAYLRKGRVVDVPRMGEATVRMDLGDLVLEGVKQRHLETVLPTRGGKVIVVRGAEKGVTGKLLAKDRDRQTALVQVYEDLRAMSLSLDDVAEFTGMLDEDVEDIGF